MSSPVTKEVFYRYQYVDYYGVKHKFKSRFEMSPTQMDELTMIFKKYQPIFPLGHDPYDLINPSASVRQSIKEFSEASLDPDEPFRFPQPVTRKTVLPRRKLEGKAKSFSTTPLTGIKLLSTPASFNLPYKSKPSGTHLRLDTQEACPPPKAVKNPTDTSYKVKKTDNIPSPHGPLNNQQPTTPTRGLCAIAAKLSLTTPTTLAKQEIRDEV